MTRRKANEGLDFEALRRGIERCDLERVLGFYAEDAALSIVNAGAPQSSFFELRGRAEIAKYLRAAFGPETSHRVEREHVGRERVTFRETCEYPDGGRVVVETTLELRDSKIVSQTDVVARDMPTEHEDEIDHSHPDRKTHPRTRLGVDASAPRHLLRFEQATDKEDLG